MGSDGDKRKSDDVFVLNAGGSWMQPAFVHSAEFGECSAAPFDALASDPDSIADFETFHVGADFCDGAGEVAAKDVGKGKFGGNHSAANISVDGIHIDSGDFDEAFGSAG